MPLVVEKPCLPALGLPFTCSVCERFKPKLSDISHALVVVSSMATSSILVESEAATLVVSVWAKAAELIKSASKNKSLISQ